MIQILTFKSVFWWHGYSKANAILSLRSRLQRVLMSKFLEVKNKILVNESVEDLGTMTLLLGECGYLELLQLHRIVMCDRP